MPRNARRIAVLAAVAATALAPAGAAQAAVKLTPKKNVRATTVLKLKLSGPEAQVAMDAPELNVILVPPASADYQDCGTHHQPTARFSMGTMSPRATITLDPNDALYHHTWCKGKWKVRVTSQSPFFDDGSPTDQYDFATASFRVKR